MARSGNAGNSGPIERAGQCRRLLPVPMSRWSSSSTARTRDVRQQPDVGVTTNLRSRRVARSAGLAARRRARQEARMRAATSVGTRSATDITAPAAGAAGPWSGRVHRLLPRERQLAALCQLATANDRVHQVNSWRTFPTPAV